MIAGALLLALAAAAEREAVGVWGGWGAFREAERCYAIAQPLRRSSPGERAAFASVALFPGRGPGRQVSARLSRELARGARVTLSIGERRFLLTGAGASAWAPDRKSSLALVAALRAARSMSIESVDSRGRPFADTYSLKGAATAIDAATVACARD
jgi:hypothetical protein